MIFVYGPVAMPIAQNQLTNKEFVRLHLDKRIVALAHDGKDYANAIDFCNLYLELLGVDRVQFSIPEILSSSYIPKFYIRDLLKTINQLPDKLGKRIIRFFNLDNSGTRHYLKTVNPNDRALVNMMKEAHQAVDYLISISAMYQYNSKMKEVIDCIAEKVRDSSNQYSNVEKAKYAHIYYQYIKDFQYMPYDEGKRILTAKEYASERNKKSYPNIGMFLEEWNTFFRYVPDQDIIVPMIQDFLNQLDEDEEMVIRMDAQLDEDKCAYIPYEEIRNCKEHIFCSGEWFNGDFMRVSALNALKASKVRELVKSWSQYLETCEWESDMCEECTILIPTEGYKTFVLPVFNKKAKFKDEWEMMAFINLMRYFLKIEPEFKYHGKRLSQYDFSIILQ